METGYNKEEAKERLFMKIENLRILHKEGHVIGLHSHTHPTVLSNLSIEEQKKEYTMNFLFLESLLGETPWSMSHPCGNYNEDTLKILKSLRIKVGFRSSLDPQNVRTHLEVPREDHTNIFKKLL